MASTSKSIAQVQAEGDFAIKPQSVAPALGQSTTLPSLRPFLTFSLVMERTPSQILARPLPWLPPFPNVYSPPYLVLVPMSIMPNILFKQTPRSGPFCSRTTTSSSFDPVTSPPSPSYVPLRPGIASNSMLPLPRFFCPGLRSCSSFHFGPPL